MDPYAQFIPRHLRNKHGGARRAWPDDVTISRRLEYDRLMREGHHGWARLALESPSPFRARHRGRVSEGDEGDEVGRQSRCRHM